MATTGEPRKTRLKSIIFPQRYNYSTRTEKVSLFKYYTPNLAFYEPTKIKVWNYSLNLKYKLTKKPRTIETLTANNTHAHRGTFVLTTS